MTNQIYIMGFISCLLTACASDNNQTLNPLEDRYEQKGRISIPLTATSSSGETYRVVLPEVSLVGPDEEYTLHLQDESEFDYSLKEGEWMMEIVGDWGLERLVDGEFVAVSAEMTSRNPQVFSIFAGETTLATISFRVMEEEQDTEVEFQHGDLEIQIEIDDDSTEAIECSIHSPVEYQAAPGELLFIDWEMEGNISEDAYVAVFSEWGETYYLAVVTENDGRVAWTLPGDLDPNLEYHVYIEDAEDGARRTTCWDYTPLIVTAPEEDCSVEFATDNYQAIPGETITIEWEMSGNISEQVYLSVHSEGGQTYYLSTIVENSGSFEWTLPGDLNPHLSYNIYVEDAESDARRSTCWRYQGLEVVVP